MITPSRYWENGVQCVDLLETRELLQYRHLVGAIICLGERPMRYSEMACAITEWTGSRIGDGEITRTVHRLVDDGLVEESLADGRQLFTLTESGRRRLEVIEPLGCAVSTSDSATPSAPRMKARI